MTTEKKSLGIQEIIGSAAPPLSVPDGGQGGKLQRSSDERKTLRAIENVSFNEPIFQGALPGQAGVPGVLILEAMAQATGILAFTMVGKPFPNELYYFASIDNARFKRPVGPGDQLVLDVEFLKERRGIAKFTGVATVDGEVVCTAELMCAKREV